jgi:hypothetical protein
LLLPATRTTLCFCRQKNPRSNSLGASTLRSLPPKNIRPPTGPKNTRQKNLLEKETRETWCIQSTIKPAGCILT